MTATIDDAQHPAASTREDEQTSKPRQSHNPVLSKRDASSSRHEDELKFKEAYESLRARAEFEPNTTCLALAQLARRIDAAGVGELARRAHCSAAHGFAAIGDYPRAENELRRCLVSAKRDRHRADQHRATFVKATIQRDSGLHDASVRSLLSLLNDDAMAEMPATLRLAVLDLLAEASLPVDPIDSVDACLSLSNGHWSDASKGPPPDLPGFFLVNRAGHFLDRYHLTAPEFQTLLTPVKQTQDERTEALHLALNDCARVPTSTVLPKPTPLVLQVSEFITQLARAHLAQDIRLAMDLWQSIREAEISNPHFQLRAGHQVASAMLLLGQPAMAAKVVDHYQQRLTDQGGCTERRLFWMHLRSVVAAASGQASQSLALYTEYSQAAFAHAGRMNLHLKQLIAQVTGLAQKTSSSVTPQVPHFLRKALDLLEQPRYQLLPIDQLAELSGVTSRTLRAAFAKHLGSSPKEVSTMKRLDAALAYLKTHAGKNEPLAEIARRFGFTNTSRFATQFKRRHGEAPVSFLRRRP